jgi:hypothetical protein
MRNIDHLIGGAAFASGERQGDVFDPNNGGVQAKVRLGTAADLDKAVKIAIEAQHDWAATNPQRRARVMFKFKELVEKNMEELAVLLSSEHGKVIADARGDVMRGLDVIEFSCGIPHALKGEYTQGAGPGIDVYSMRQPLGVVVAGNIDIRGTSVVDGSIIVTGDGAGNTTLGYFGADDGSTDPSAMPEGGYGRLNIRYNPHRALPDGINIAIDLTGDPDTYAEGLQ